MKRQTALYKVKNPLQTCMVCHKTTTPMKDMKERCGVCKKIYLIYRSKE